MQRNISPALKTVAISALAVILSLFVYVSIFTMVFQFSTKVVGYTLYEITEDGEAVDIETLSEPPKTMEENQNYRQERSEMSVGASAVMGILQTLCGLGIVFCFVGSILAKEAARDRNDVDFNGAKADKMRGFKIGALAAIPLLAVNVATLVVKIMGSAGATLYWVYRWVLLSPVKPLVDLITGNAANLSAAPLWSVIVLFAFTLLFVAFCGVLYLLCYNEDSVIAKVIYKSTKKKEKRKGW